MFSRSKCSDSIILILFIMLLACQPSSQRSDTFSEPKPNIIILYLDDLGYGDLSSYGATELSTPNIDALSNGGVRFTNGYATSATCTPSRFALLTGTYPWRNKNARILSGSAPLIIDTSQVTLPKMLKSAGYETAIIGKWHLGLGAGDLDWNQRIAPGPNEVGFDHSYILAATQDRVPTVYIENGHVVNLDPEDPISINYKNNFEGEPTGKDNPELTTMKWHHGHKNSIVNGIPRIGYMQGGQSAKWNDLNMADHFLLKAQSYIEENKNSPFFLYYAMQQPHVPRTPHPRFVGRSGLGPRGDVIVEADWCIGELMKTLKKEGLLDNTLIILSSDNGPVLNDGYYDDAVEKLGGHTPAGSLRGGKYSLFEGGTRVPFITYWKGKVKPQTSEAMVCQIDLLNSLAQLVGSEISTADGEKMLKTLMGQSKTGRETLIIESKGKTALRKGNWLMIPPYSGPAINAKVNIEIGNSSTYQLYNLTEDVGQKINLAELSESKLNEMIREFDNLRAH